MIGLYRLLPIGGLAYLFFEAMPSVTRREDVFFLIFVGVFISFD